MPSSVYQDRIADRDAVEKASNEFVHDQSLAKAQKFLRPYMEVLELGCGTGSATMSHAPYVKRIRATDYSKAMINIAEKRKDRQGVDNVYFECESINDLARDHRLYDAIIAYDVLHLVPNLEEALQSIFDHLNPGGFFVSSTPCWGGGYQLLRPFWPVLKALGVLPPACFFSKNDMMTSANSVGFEVIETSGSPGPTLFLVARKLKRR